MVRYSWGLRKFRYDKGFQNPNHITLDAWKPYPKLHERGLYASCDGTVRYTRELYVPPPDTIEVQFVIFSKHSRTWPTCSFCPSGLISKLNR